VPFHFGSDLVASILCTFFSFLFGVTELKYTYMEKCEVFYVTEDICRDG
jgi:hypothetical protein